MLNVLTKYLANSLIYNSAVSTSPYIEFPSKIQYYYRNFFVMITKSTMTSGHLMYIPTFILGYSNAASMSHISKIHPYSSYYQVSTIRIIFEVYDAIGDNDSVKSIPGTCMYPLTKFLDFWKNNPSWSSLILNTHLKGTGFLILVFTTLLFVIIPAFLDRKLLSSEIADIYQKCPFGLGFYSLRVSGSPESV